MEAAAMGFSMEDFAPMFTQSQLAGVIDFNFSSSNAELEIRPSDYEERHKSIVERYNKKSEELNRLLEKLTEHQNKIQAMKILVQGLSETDTIIEEFDDDLWRMTVEKVMVHRGERLIFVFYDGTEIED